MLSEEFKLSADVTWEIENSRVLQVTYKCIYIWEVTVFKVHLQLNLDWKSVFKKNIQVYIFQVQSGYDLNLIPIRVPQEDYKRKLLGKQVQNQLEKSLQLAISLKI